MPTRIDGHGGSVVYFAKYVVARFCPLLDSFFVETPSFRMRGISFGSSPSFCRISSARSPFFCVLTRRTILLSVAAISSSERRRRRPFALGAGERSETALRAAPDEAKDFGGSARSDRPPPAFVPPSSSRDVSRMAPRTCSANVAARACSWDWRVMAGEGKEAIDPWLLLGQRPVFLNEQSKLAERKTAPLLRVVVASPGPVGFDPQGAEQLTGVVFDLVLKLRRSNLVLGHGRKRLSGTVMRREETHRTLTVRPFSVRLPSMMVDIAALYRSIGRLTWRSGVVQPERLKHRVLPDGSHRIE